MAALEASASRALSVRNGTNGVLLLHGFTGSPASMRPLAEAFLEAGLSVELPLLPGHGASPEDLDRTGFSDWRAAVEQAYVALSADVKRVLVVGLSLGGTLALSLGSAHQEIAGLVLINPYAEPPVESFLDLMRGALSSGVRAIPSIGSDIKRPGVSGGGYDETPIAPLLSLFEGVRETCEQLSSIEMPVLLFSSRVDHVVAPSSSDRLEKELPGAVERIVLENSFHVATLDNDAEELERRAVRFAEEVLGR